MKNYEKLKTTEGEKSIPFKTEMTPFQSVTVMEKQGGNRGEEKNLTSVISGREASETNKHDTETRKKAKNEIERSNIRKLKEEKKAEKWCGSLMDREGNMFK